MEKNNKFDRIIREKLENIQPGYDPENWELFEQRLDLEETGMPETEDRVIDEVIFGKLHRLEVDYDPSTWKRMVIRIDEEFGWVRRLYRYKAMELSLMMLLLLTFAQFLPLNDYHHQPLLPGPDIKKEVPGNQPRPAFDQTPAQSQERAQADNAGSNEHHSRGNSQNPEIQNKRTEDNPAIRFFSQRNKKTNGKRGSTVTENNRRISFEPVYRLPSILPELRRKADGALQLNMSPLSVAPVKNRLDLFDKLAGPELSYVEYDTYYDVSTREQPIREKTHIRFGMAGSWDYNRIITPPIATREITQDLRQDTVSADRYALGYGGGFTIGFERKRWEIETGFIYTAKTYQPLPVVFFEGDFDDGYYGEGFKSVELNMVNIPLNLRYNVYKQDSWRAYVLGGASLHIAVQANYYIANQDAFRNSRSRGPAPVPTDSNPNRPAGIRNQKAASGWLEGGTFEENSYITGNIGLGVEKYMSPQWSLFAQPTYFHSVHHFRTGMGPYSDRINTFSLLMGVKIQLK